MSRARARTPPTRSNDAAGAPQVFGAPTASDGIMMGHQGMRYSLVSREGIADSIEVVAGGMNHDGVLAIGGCDKNMPGCLMAMARVNIPSIFVYTHDSVGLGEDGPTHQPIEHLMSLRALPRLSVVRPGDANEVSYAWKLAMEHDHGPTALVLSRQALPILPQTANGGAEGVLRGAYVLSEAAAGRIDALLLATGSELSLAVEAQGLLAGRGVNARVVSMPCWEVFAEQDARYRAEVLPPEVRARVSIEAGVTLGWERWVGDEGDSIGIDNRFGASSPYQTIMKEFGFTAENVAARVQAVVERVVGVRA